MKVYDIDVDCAACALKMEEAAKNTDGIKDAQVDFDEGSDEKTVMKQVRKNCKKVESDCEIYI